MLRNRKIISVSILANINQLWQPNNPVLEDWTRLKVPVHGNCKIIQYKILFKICLWVSIRNICLKCHSRCLNSALECSTFNPATPSGDNSSTKSCHVCKRGLDEVLYPWFEPASALGSCRHLGSESLIKTHKPSLSFSFTCYPCDFQISKNKCKKKISYMHGKDKIWDKVSNIVVISEWWVEGQFSFFPLCFSRA